MRSSRKNQSFCLITCEGAFFPVGGQVAISQVVTAQTIVSHDTSAVENRQGAPWESALVDTVGLQTCRGDDVIVVTEFDVGQMQLPIALSLVDGHIQIWAIVWFTCSTPRYSWEGKMGIARITTFCLWSI